MLKLIQSGAPLTFRQRLSLTVKLSWPAIMAQLSSIMMQYIDAAMVGRLGADDSASVGLVSTSLWLFWGICSAATVGFSVQVSHRIGAADYAAARGVLRQGITASIAFGVIMAVIGLAIASPLPGWLGGSGAVNHKATIYFMVFVGALPLLTLNYLGSAMLRASGNMKTAGALNVMMCLLDVVFNYFLIFPSGEVTIGGMEVTVPGAGLGVLGAALGTVCAETVTAALVMWYACWRQKDLAVFGSVSSRRNPEPGSSREERGRRAFIPTGSVLRNALKVSAPMTLEHAVICGAQIMVTVIVAPLGVMAIAANAFAVTAEALCYMPGYGIGDAATTLVGQSYGARRKDLARQFGYLTVGLGMAVMTVMGVILWLCAPAVMSLLSPVADIQALGTSALRIEAWAEPMFAASIVAYGVMVGVGDTIVPAAMNFSSIWLVRLPIAALLAPSMGLNGVWLAMCIELCFRGSIFLWRLVKGSWLRRGL
ncbi:MAG: MATE family efflux transporter [Muribaculaceae bacterium]|nr:MATE family efflux transporter [Muribaculaceae bacterium]